MMKSNFSYFVMGIILFAISLPDLLADELPVQLISNQVYATVGEKELKADIYQPQGKGPFPGVLMVHGGAWAGGSRSHMALHAKNLAANGYCVASISYRLAPQHKFPTQLEDCQLALNWFFKNAHQFNADPNRLATYGYSAGAHLACLLATTTTNSIVQQNVPAKTPQIKAVVAGGTPCDFTNEPMESLRLAYFLGDSRAKLPEAYKAASPVQFISKHTPPIFFFHGSSDRIVPIADAVDMHNKLKQLGVSSELHSLKSTGHLGAFFDNSAKQEALQFLNRILISTASPAE